MSPAAINRSSSPSLTQAEIAGIERRLELGQARRPSRHLFEQDPSPVRRLSPEAHSCFA
jgi:hypothetical protein